MALARGLARSSRSRAPPRGLVGPRARHTHVTSIQHQVRGQIPLRRPWLRSVARPPLRHPWLRGRRAGHTGQGQTRARGGKPGPGLSAPEGLARRLARGRGPRPRSVDPRGGAVRGPGSGAHLHHGISFNQWGLLPRAVPRHFYPMSVLCRYHVPVRAGIKVR